MVIEKMRKVSSHSIKLSIAIIGLLFLLSCATDQSLKPSGRDLSTKTTKNTSGHDIQVSPQKDQGKKKRQPIAESEDIKKKGINIMIKKGLTVKVRPEPSLKKKQFALLKGGDVIEVIDEKGKWIKVRFKERNNKQIIGWIYNSTVEPYRNNVERKNKSHKTKINKLNETSPEQLSPM